VTAERTEQDQGLAAHNSPAIDVRHERFGLRPVERDELGNRERERAPGIGNGLGV
jgi:hypothetical protein